MRPTDSGRNDNDKPDQPTHHHRRYEVGRCPVRCRTSCCDANQLCDPLLAFQVVVATERNDEACSKNRDWMPKPKFAPQKRLLEACDCGVRGSLRPTSGASLDDGSPHLHVSVHFLRRRLTGSVRATRARQWVSVTRISCPMVSRHPATPKVLGSWANPPDNGRQIRPHRRFLPVETGPGPRPERPWTRWPATGTRCGRPGVNRDWARQ